jgi:hypothetical protein
VLGRRRGAGAADAGPRRRTGPPGEEPWWDPAAQAWAEQPALPQRVFGRTWIPVPMMNNAERLDPLGDDRAGEEIRAARLARRLVALDEGQAWRRRNDGALLVLRVEVFADDEPDAAAAHRAAWGAHGESALDALWRERWRERDIEPGWIETRWRQVDERPGELHGFRDAPPDEGPAGRVDWLTVEDHTDTTGEGSVTCYQYLLVWRGHATTTVTARHDLGADAERELEAVALALADRPGPG